MRWHCWSISSTQSTLFSPLPFSRCWVKNYSLKYLLCAISVYNLPLGRCICEMVVIIVHQNTKCTCHGFMKLKDESLENYFLSKTSVNNTGIRDRLAIPTWWCLVSIAHDSEGGSYHPYAWKCHYWSSFGAVSHIYASFLFWLHSDALILPFSDPVLYICQNCQYMTNSLISSSPHVLEKMLSHDS